MILSPLLAASNGGFWAPIANPLAAVLAFFYSLVPNYGIAIVLLTILMMVVLTPLTIKQTRSMLVMQKLQPEMKKLQEQHKNDRQALNEAVMALYKEHNASPLGGCLPMLLPFPLFIGLLRVLEGLAHTTTTMVNGHKVVTAMPKYLTSHTRMYKDIVAAHGQLDAFGMNLAKSARNVGGGFVHTLPFFVLLLIMVGTQFYQQYQLTSKNPAAASQPGQAMMMKFIPLFFGFISLNFPAGVVLYWTVSNIIRIGQQWALYRYDPKVKSLVAKDIKEIEAKTREIDAKEAKDKGNTPARGATPAKGAAPSRRPSLRDLLSNASQAAAERRGLGKSPAKPGSSPSGAKAGTPAKGTGRPPATKAPGGTSGGGVNKAVRPGTPPGRAGGAQKGVPSKPGAGGKAGAGAAGGAGKPGAGAGTGAAGGAGKPGTGASSAAGKPGTAKTTPLKPSGGAPKPGGTKPPITPTGSGNGAPTAKPAAAPVTAPVPDKVTNGATNGVPTSSGNGAPASSAGDGKPANGAGRTGGGPSKGRTGGGSARNVSSRRRKGR